MHSSKGVLRIMDKLKKALPLIAFIVGVVFLIGAVLVFTIGTSFVGSITDGVWGVIAIVFTVLMGIVMILFGAASGFYGFLLIGGRKPNFFLYDQRTNSNINVEDLEFSQVNGKMTYFLTTISDHPSQLWEQNIIGSEHEQFGEDDLYRPLVAYKMLYALVEHDSPAQWQWYLASGGEVIESVAAAVAMSGDEGLANAVRKLHATAAGDYAKTRKFLCDNRVYLEKKMLKYVKSNIDKF